MISEPTGWSALCENCSDNFEIQACELELFPTQKDFETLLLDNGWVQDDDGEWYCSAGCRDAAKKEKEQEGGAR